MSRAMDLADPSQPGSHLGGETREQVWEEPASVFTHDALGLIRKIMLTDMSGLQIVRRPASLDRITKDVVIAHLEIFG